MVKRSVCLCVVRRIPFSRRRERERPETDLLSSLPFVRKDTTESFCSIFSFFVRMNCVRRDVVVVNRRAASSPCLFITRFLPYVCLRLLVCRRTTEARNIRSNIFLLNSFVASSDPHSNEKKSWTRTAVQFKKSEEADSLSVFSPWTTGLFEGKTSAAGHSVRLMPPNSGTSSDNDTSSGRKRIEHLAASLSCCPFFYITCFGLTSILIPCHHMVSGITWLFVVSSVVEAHAVNIRKGRDFFARQENAVWEKERTGKCASVHT